MKSNLKICSQLAIVAFGVIGTFFAADAQVNTNPISNLTISWDFNSWGFANSTGDGAQPVPGTSAGLALATNWNDSWEENESAVNSSGVTVNNLFDITGATTSAGLTYAAYNGYAGDGDGYRPNQDANGTYNMQMLNGYLNAGPAAWSPPITNSYVALTNIPYSTYDVVVYIDADTSGRNFRLSDGPTSYYATTPGGVAEVEGTNALFLPTTQTNNTQAPGADFAFFPGLTGSTNKFTCYPLSGNDQWLGISGFQVIQASNVYVLYGASPAMQTIPVGQPASFSVIAGGLHPAYQWQHAGTNISNATNSTYTIASTVAGEAGNYDIVVGNSFSSATSSVAILTFYSPKSLEWNGAGSAWDATSPNWTLNHGGSSTNYTQTDNVLFDLLGTAQSTALLSSIVTPTSITVSNASYEFTSGGIGGSGSLHVAGNGSLILDTIDSSTGPTLIDNGSTLQLDNNDAAGSFGSGALTNNGMLVINSTGNPAYGYPVYGTGTIANNGSGGEVTLGNNISAGYLEQNGGGTLLLQGSNNISGALEISDGTVWARAPHCLALNNIVSGGELQLIFGIDFAGTNITLSGGDLHGGVSGDNTFDGTVTLTVDSQINVDTGDSLTLDNPSGISGAGYNLYLGGSGGTLILTGNNNTWDSVNFSVGTLQIGNGGAGGSLGGGTIENDSVLAFDLSGNLDVTNPISGGGEINQVGTGEVYFTGDVSGLAGLTAVSSGTLGGTTTFGGPVSVLPGTTLAAGTPSAIGTLTVQGGVTIGGNVLVKINKSLTQPNDYFIVSGTLDNTNAGSIIVDDLGPALKAGDKFTLFSQPVSGGAAMSVTGGGVVWSNNLANDGSIIVLSTVVPRPVIQSIVLASGNFIVNGTNGVANQACYLLSSTNLTAPLSQWIRVSTNAFDSTDNIHITNAISGTKQNFYILQE
jgi:autotransporter-associated beta strand protein